MGAMADGESDEFKRILLEGNPVLLAVTFAVSLLHSVFDVLAFKNDIGFWKNKKNVEGLSVRTILINCFCQVRPRPATPCAVVSFCIRDACSVGCHAVCPACVQLSVLDLLGLGFPFCTAHYITLFDTFDILPTILVGISSTRQSK